MKTLLFFLALAASAHADIIYLKNGGKLEGKVTPRGKSYLIETSYGKVTIKKSDVLRIEKKEWTPDKKGMPEKKAALLREKYAHPFLAFKIYLPPKWQRGPTRGKVSCSFYGPKDFAYRPRIDLMVQFNKTELADYVSMYKTAYKKVDPDALFPFDEVTTIAGLTAYQFSVIFKSGGIPYQTLWTILEAKGRKIVLSYACTQAWFAKYYARVDASMRSIHVYPLPSATKEEKSRFLEAYNAGQAAYGKKRYRSALRHYKKAAKLLPNFPELYGLLGQAYWRLRNYFAAEKAYRKAIAMDPKDYDQHYNLGVILLLQSKYEAAIVSLEEAVKLGPEMEAALTNLGVAYLATEEADKALKVLDRAVLLDPESIPAYYNLGLAYERTGEFKKARRQFRDTIQLDKGHKGAKEGLGRIRDK